MKRVSELFSNSFPENVCVLIIDNHSTDGTFSCLYEASKKLNGLRVLQNTENLGYAGNFIRFFNEVNTDYILFTSDEDEVLVEKLPEFIDFLEINTPTFVSPQAIAFDRIYRGAGKKDRIIPADFHESSFYLSGITFDVKLGRSAANKVKSVLTDNSAAYLYPQSLIAAELLIEGMGFWYPDAITLKRAQLDSHISNPDGSPYYHLVARYQQSIDFVTYLKAIADSRSDLSSTELNISKKMIEEVKVRFFESLRTGLSAEHPEFLAAFDKSARRFYSLPLRLRYLCAEGIRSPRKVIPFIRKMISRM